MMNLVQIVWVYSVFGVHSALESVGHLFCQTGKFKAIILLCILPTLLPFSSHFGTLMVQLLDFWLKTQKMALASILFSISGLFFSLLFRLGNFWVIWTQFIDFFSPLFLFHSTVNSSTEFLYFNVKIFSFKISIWLSLYILLLCRDFFISFLILSIILLVSIMLIIASFCLASIFSIFRLGWV